MVDKYIVFISKASHNLNENLAIRINFSSYILITNNESII